MKFELGHCPVSYSVDKLIGLGIRTPEGTAPVCVEEEHDESNLV